MFGNTPPVIGMLHLAALPGAPRASGDLRLVVEAALRDADALVAGGAAGLMLENFGDLPFFPGPVPPWTIAAMTAAAVAVRSRFAVPLGINVLRNDGVGALSVAHAAGAQFIRVNVLTGARLTDQGIINGIAHDLLRERARLGAESIAIWADVDVKHSAALAPRTLADETADVIRRALADTVIVSGYGTGAAALAADVATVKKAAGSAPVVVGSGISADTVSAYAAHADGFIVGTSLKEDGRVDRPVDRARVAQLVAAIARR